MALWFAVQAGSWSRCMYEDGFLL